MDIDKCEFCVYFNDPLFKESDCNKCKDNDGFLSWEDFNENMNMYLICDYEKWLNCYFKQIKRLHEEYDTAVNKFLNSETDKYRLEQENEEQKQNAQDTYDMYKALMESFEISNTERNKYKQTLKEIKNLLQQIDEQGWLHAAKHIYMDEKCIFYLKEKIQSKIDETLNSTEAK